MATAATIKKNIAKLEAALKSKATPKSLKSKLETQLVKSKAELSGLNKGTKPKTSSTKSTQSALKNLKELVNKNKKYKNYKGAGVDLERDADRPAKPIGRRTAKASGKTYYEYRANRIDVKQPPKRYPKLEKGGVSDEVYTKGYQKYRTEEIEFSINYKENGKMKEAKIKSHFKGDAVEEWRKKHPNAELIGVYEKVRFSKKEQGGYMAEGGSLSSIKEEYEENEDNNAHSENVVLLAKHFGTKEDLAEAKRILALHEKEGHLTSENGKKRQELHLKLIEKARTAMDKEGIEFAKGGMFEKPIAAIQDKYGNIKSEKTLYQDLEYLKDAYEDKLITKDEYDKSYEEIKEQLKFLQKKAKGGYYAKGGAMEHGLKRGDTIIDDMSWDNSVKVLNNKTGYAVVHLETGERKEMKAMGGEMHRTQE